MIQDVEAAIREYLPNVIHMALATSVEDQPWVCQVHFAYDNDLNIYFRSLSSTRHCRNIAANPRVAGSITTQHTVKDQLRCVSFEGTAEHMISEVERAAVIEHLVRLGEGAPALEMAKDPEGFQFYKIKVDTFYMFDTRESKPSHKYELPWGKKA